MVFPPLCSRKPGQTGRSGHGPSILHLDLGVLDHRAPFGGLRLQEGGELFFRRAFRHRAEALEMGALIKLRTRASTVFGITMRDTPRRMFRYGIYCFTLFCGSAIVLSWVMFLIAR